MKVEVIYLSETKQVQLFVDVEKGSQIRHAILLSNILERCPEIDLEKHAVGVFSEKRSLDDAVFEGDRIEIYLPLKVDPKARRRAKAIKA